MGGREVQPAAMLQEGVFAPGVQESIPESRLGARQQQLLSGYAAMGTVGGGQHGLNPIPPSPPPTWSRGGHSWVYDGVYGNGQRPTTGIWAKKGFGGPMDGEPAANDGGVEEEDAVQTQEPSEPAAQEPAAAKEPAEDFAEPAADGGEEGAVQWSQLPRARKRRWRSPMGRRNRS